MATLVTVRDFEDHAKQILSKTVFEYYKNGAGQGQTLAENKGAFSKYRIRPRCLRNVENRDMSVTILGQKVRIPIGISPTALQRMAHPEGECANARAAQSVGTIFVLSTLATSSIEEVATAAPEALKWFQLFIYKDRKVVTDLVRRAETAGFKALVLTVDAPLIGLRVSDIRNQFSIPAHLSLANFASMKPTDVGESNDGGPAITAYVNSLLGQNVLWEDVKWLKSITKLPIVLKGVLTAQDAWLGVEAGADAILVSNHGARQLDGTPATIDVLPEIVKAVGDKVEIYIDGGVTDGTQIFKALAMGAKMVFLGRAPLWGLAHSGEDGVKKVFRILENELDYTLAMSGCAKISDIAPEMVVHESYFSKI